VNQALATLDAYNGVIIADVVGLGKTVVGSLIGYMRRKRGIVIAPPGLVGDGNETTGWKAYLREFHLNDWRVRSCGDLENTLQFVNNDQDFEMVIVDEAHRFRNQDTEDYHYLSQICRGKEVVLLTATPFNNHPNDFFSLLKLFMPTKKTSLVLDGNLAVAFKGYGIEFAAIHEVLKHRGKTDGKTMEKIAKSLVKLGIEPAQYVQAPEEFVKGLRKRAKRLAAMIRRALPEGTDIRLVSGVSMAGGGSLPTREIPTVLIGLRVANLSAAALESRLRRNETPVIVRVADDRALLDLRTVDPGEFAEIRDALSRIATAAGA